MPDCAMCGEPVGGPSGWVGTSFRGEFQREGCWALHGVGALPIRDAEPLDVYMAFRLAFLGHPTVRICTRPAREVSDRFAQAKLPCRVYLWEDRAQGCDTCHGTGKLPKRLQDAAWVCEDFKRRGVCPSCAGQPVRALDVTEHAPLEVPLVATPNGLGYRNLAHWAEISESWWSGEAVGMKDGFAAVFDPETGRAT